jgi:Phytanoyl-CoA dioxygenase (PhyH)
MRFMAMITATSSAPAARVDDVLTAIVDPEYWLNLNPGLSVDGASVTLAGCSPDLAEIDRIAKDVVREGYFQIDQLLPSPVVGRMAEAVRRLHVSGNPPVFAFVYDEFWSLCRLLAPALRRILNANYCQLPDFWVWYVDPVTESAGWPPHREKGHFSVLPGGSPKSLTIWIALTDATPLNGCIYIVPAHLDPPSQHADRRRVPVNMQDVRALPVAAGSVLGWNQAILHWGGRASGRASHPRISMACEFQRGDIEPFSRPLLNPLQPPAFEQRLGLIGMQILQYRNMNGSSETLTDVGERLTGRFLSGKDA